MSRRPSAVSAVAQVTFSPAGRLAATRAVLTFSRSPCTVESAVRSYELVAVGPLDAEASTETKQSDFSTAKARRIALAAQGFDRRRSSGRVGLADLRRVIRQLGLLQIDYFNVLAPAQYQVLFSRLGPYKMSLLDDLVYRRREFTEQWAHEASIVPVETWPLLRHRMDAHRVRPDGFEKFLESEPDYVAWVLDQVRDAAPWPAAKFPCARTSPTGSNIPGSARSAVPSSKPTSAAAPSPSPTAGPISPGCMT